MPSTCPGCGSSNPADFDDSSGVVVCTACGTVVDESCIVSEISFGETSSGAAVVQGSFVGEGQTHATGGGRFRSGNSLESREHTIAEGRRRIIQLGSALHCPEHFADAAQRWFTLAVTNNFTKGRRTQYVVACCLYVVCRQNKSSHMLIDFSDILHINVFTLGQTYLKLVRLLNIRMPNIDPTIYVHRFAKNLEFGNDQNKVAKDALRLIQRMNRDWIVHGRRPSGICGAALILAARMNNFRRSVKEVVYVVKVADLTIHKRLAEFKETKSGDLTVEEFRNIWLEQAHDPPSFGAKKKKRKRVREVNEDGEVIPDSEGTAQNEELDDAATENCTPAPTQSEPLRIDADGFVIPALPIDPLLLAADSESVPPFSKPLLSSSSPFYPTPPTTNLNTPISPADAPDIDPEEIRKSAIADAAIESEINMLLNDKESEAIVEELREAHRREMESLPKKFVSDDPENLDDVDDDDEVKAALLTQAESDIKEKIWTEYNKDYLREQEIKRLKAEVDARNGIIKQPRKRRKTKPRDSTSADLAASPAESAKQMLKRRTYSKKINYKAIEGLFDD
ncbi:transcription factor TFIIIB subunit brf1 [Rhizina undulata]